MTQPRHAVIAALALVACAAASTAAEAQPIEIGVKGGASLTTVTGPFTAAAPLPGDADARKRLGVNWVAGVFVDLPLAPRVAFAPELLVGRESVTVRGVPFGPGSLPDPTKDRREASYGVVRVPALMRVHASGSGAAPFLVAGPELVIAFNGHDAEGLRTASVAATGGAGIRTAHAIVEGRVSVGLTPINDAPDSGASPYRFLDYERRRRVVTSMLLSLCF